MINLLNICVLLIVIPTLGKMYYPNLLSSLYIQVPSVILASVLLGAGFVVSLSKYFKTNKPSFAGILLPSGFLLVFILLQLLSLFAVKVMTPLTSFKAWGVISENKILDRLTSGVSESERLRVAQFVFTDYGSRVPYKLDSGQFVQYEPTEADFKILKESQLSAVQYKKMMEMNAYLASYILQLSILELLLFFTGFAGAFLWEVNAIRTFRRTL